jgi:hypothetical protein
MRARQLKISFHLREVSVKTVPDPAIPSVFWVHGYVHRGPVSGAIIESNVS